MKIQSGGLNPLPPGYSSEPHNGVVRWRSGSDRGFNLNRYSVECHLWQVVRTHFPLLPSSIIWYHHKLEWRINNHTVRQYHSDPVVL